MSEEQLLADTTEPAEATEDHPAAKPDVNPGDSEGELPDWARKKLEKSNREAQNLRARLKEYEPKAKQFDEITEAQKSELDKALERAEKAEAERLAIEQRAIRAEVASEKGVPGHLVTGSTREEMEAAADAALAWRGTIPAPDFGGGRRGDDTGSVAQMSQTELDRLFAAGKHDAIIAARKEGRLNTLMATKK